MVPTFQNLKSHPGGRNMSFLKMVMLRPKYNCLKSKPGRVPILWFCYKGACRRSNMVCVGGRSWWPKYTHFGIRCPCRRVFVNIVWRGRNMQFSQTGYTFNMGRGSKCRVHAGQIRLSMYQNEGRTHDLFCKFSSWRSTCFHWF